MNTKSAGSGLGTILLIVVALLWTSGKLDTLAYQVGLNRNPCVVVYLTGQVVCGDAAKTFCDSQGCDGTQP